MYGYIDIWIYGYRILQKSLGTQSANVERLVFIRWKCSNYATV